MKNRNIKSIYILMILLLGISCEPYLEKPPFAEVDEEDVFENFDDYMGFVDVCYACFLDYNDIGQNGFTQWGDEMYCESGNTSWSMTGDYWGFYDAAVSLNNPRSGNDALDLDRDEEGIYNQSYIGMRAANMAIEKIGLFKGTERQKDLLLGQAYFFKAFFHWQLVKLYGGVPYISRTIPPEDASFLGRLTVMETVDSIAADLQKAADILPENWNEELDNLPFSGFNTELGRVTKGAAYATKAQALLFAGSPLGNYYSKGYTRSDASYTFSSYYMEEAAKAAYEVIKLADAGVYGLVGYNEFNSMFLRDQNISTWISPSGIQETIWAKVTGNTGSNNVRKSWGAQPINTVNKNCFATQNMVNNFLMSNGYEIDHPSSGYNLQDPWTNRDPRLAESIIKHGDRIYDDPGFVWDGSNTSPEPVAYLVRKYIPRTVTGNNYNVQLTCPHARLADMYLIYAEAVNELVGPITAPAFASLTAVDAVNAIRRRPLVRSADAGIPDDLTPMMPDVLDIYKTQDTFREHVRNERTIELAYEANHWFDIRRWHIAHLPEYKSLYNLGFDDDGSGNLSNFEEVKFYTRVFDEKHYWFPFPLDQVKFTDAFPQNPGW